MSIAFSDTTNKDGLIQQIEQALGFPDGFISGDSTRLKIWAGSINRALDKAFHIIFLADGRWQFDDGNHTTYPILTGNLVDGQRDYSFTADSAGNLVLDIARVFVRMATTEPYYEVFPRDVQSDRESEITSFVDGLNTEGRPQYYDKTATGIFLDPIPNANVSSGLKVYVSREGSYFTSADAAKVPGFAGLYHEYLVVEPAYRYALGNNLANREALKRDVMEIEKALTEFYSKRDPHDRPVITGEPFLFE